MHATHTRCSFAVAHSHSGHGYITGSSLALSKGSRVPQASAAAVLPQVHSSSPLSSTAAALGGRSRSLAPASPLASSRQLVQAAAGGSAAGGRSSRGGGRGGRGRDFPRPDGETLEELQAAVTSQLPVWVQREDTMAISTAFRKTVQLRLGTGTAATAARTRTSILAKLAEAYLPLVSRARNAADCRTPLWAMAKAGISSSGAGAQLAAALLQRLVTDSRMLAAATPVDLSLALYALGKLREDWQRRGGDWEPAVSQSVGALADAIKGRLASAVGHGFNAQDVSNALWACAKLGLADKDLLQRLAEAGAAVAGSMTPQALSNSLWALKATGCTGAEYRPAVQALCREALRRLRLTELAATFDPQALSNILMALEGLQLGSEQAELVAAVAAEDVRRGFTGYVAQDLSNSAWALAKMGFGLGPEAPEEQRQWVSAALQAAMQPGAMARVTPQAWSNLLYALALMRHQPPPALLDSSAAAAMQSGNGQDCSNTLYALALLRLRHAGLEAAVCGRLGELLQGGGEALAHQEVSISLWAMAVFGGTSLSAGMQQLALQLARSAAGRWEGFTVENLRQLWQAQQELGGEVAAALGHWPDMQAAMGRAVEVDRANSGSSVMQRQLVEAAQRLQQSQQQGDEPATIEAVQTGLVVEGMLARVDMLVLRDGRQIAIECTVSGRFLANQQRDPSALNGPTEWRSRQLQRRFGPGGLLRVPYWEWEGLKSPAEQEAHLLHRLQALLAEPAAADAALVTAGATAGAATARTPAGAAAPPPPGSSSPSGSSSGDNPGGSPQLLARPPRRVP